MVKGNKPERYTMKITLNQQLNYIDRKTVEFFEGKISQEKALRDIRLMMEAAPKTKSYGQAAINSIIEGKTAA